MSLSGVLLLRLSQNIGLTRFVSVLRPFTTLSIALAVVLRPSIRMAVPSMTVVLDLTWTVPWIPDGRMTHRIGSTGF